MIKRVLISISTAAVVILSTTGSGCGPECEGRKTEPYYSVNIEGVYTFKKIYALVKTDGNQLTPGADINFETPTNHLELPVDMNASVTTYIFEQENRTDSLVVEYQIVTQLEKRCGMTVKVENTSISPSTTFSDVIVISYNQITIK